MRSSPPRLVDDPALGSALAEEIAEARAYDPTELRRRTLDGAAARSGGLGTVAGAGAVAGLSLAALVAAWLWMFPRVGSEGPRPGDSAVLSPLPPDRTAPSRRPPLASAARGPAPDRLDLFVGPPMPEVGDEPMPEVGDEPARAENEAEPSVKPASSSAPSKPRIGPAARSDRPDLADRGEGKGEGEPDATPKPQAADVSAEANGTSLAPALPGGEARTTGLDDLASDLEDYDRGHASLLAGDLDRAVDELQDYLESRPLGRLRLEARLDLLEALIRLNRPAEALPLAEALLGDSAADNRRTELTRVVVELRVATGDCRGARQLASKGSQALLEAVQKCEDGGG